MKNKARLGVKKAASVQALSVDEALKMLKEDFDGPR